MSRGTIFAIEEFAVHDGPGIRKLVFFKGCPLRCTWCHNPEGLSFNKELMVSEAACTHCNMCKLPCDHELCKEFGRCVEVCAMRLPRIVGKEYEAADLVKILLKGKDILINSGGGITFSGGEPTAQSEFLFDLMRLLKPLHLALETSGHTKSEDFRRIADNVDLVLMDIKHTNPEVHKKYTGVDNKLIIKNLDYLCKAKTPFHIRIPLIPGVNDTLNNMEETALLIKDAENLVSVDFLAYHQSAPAKYIMLNKHFNPGFDTMKQVKTYSGVFEKFNIKTNVL